MASAPSERPRLPNFLVAGAPKAGTTALHRALVAHPQLLMSPVKEPKFFMCDGRRPRRQAGPGDAHSAQEWIWQPERYHRLFEGSEGRLRGESTPFYFYDREAHKRIAAAIPDVRFVVIVRDPVDRAYSNWLHLWADGLEPIGDFEEACAAEERRIARGWAPFWHYQRMGRYGEQLEHLLAYFPPSQVMVLRYRALVDTPSDVLDWVCAFLGVDRGCVAGVPGENTRGFVAPSLRTAVIGRAIRAGARLGAALPPQLWRRTSQPLVRVLQAGAGPRPPLAVGVRRRLVEQYRDDVARLGRLTGEDFTDWLADTGRGAFATRSSSAG